MLDCMDMRKEKDRFSNLSKYIIWPKKTISVQCVVNGSREKVKTVLGLVLQYEYINNFKTK